MEHPTVEAGVIRSTRQNELCDIFSPGLIDGRFVETGITPSVRVQTQSKVLNAVARARPKVSTDATQALREIIWNLKHRNIPLNLQWYNNEWLRQRLKAIARDPLSIPLNIIRHFLGKPKRFKVDSIILEIRGEQAPNPDSRVTLSDETDQFGLRRAHLHWEMTPLDKRTMRETAALFDQEIRRLGLGSVEFDPWITTDELVWPDNMVGGHHHMGTTRMSNDPASGVVDANCRAHELDNLYVAGSSVFPTSSYVNPTFTILCLAQRLADHVAGKLDNERKFGAAQGAHDDVALSCNPKAPDRRASGAVARERHFRSGPAAENARNPAADVDERIKIGAGFKTGIGKRINDVFRRDIAGRAARIGAPAEAGY